MPPRTDTHRAALPGSVLWLVWLGTLAALTAAAGSIGGTIGPGLALAIVADTLLRSGWPAAVFLFAAFGAGEWFIGAGIPRPVRFTLGMALLLTAGALLGMFGLLSTVSAVVLVLAASAGVVRPLRGSRDFFDRRSLRAPAKWLWVALPGIALLLTAASSPPGALWSSEYGGYDVLSYHLELPKEWLLLGNTRPVAHNVYSYLPGWLESAYAVLGWLSGGGDLLSGGGRRLMSAQYLHAGITIAAGWLVARLTRRLAAAAGIRGRDTASSIAGGLVVCTPWSVVVGSIAYNDMGVVLLGAGAMLAACRRSSRPGRQAALVGFLVGVACCVKPTALFFVGIPTGVMLLRFISIRHWVWAVAAGTAAGVLAVSPWLIRNAVMTGNPVFPFATGLLGTGHWTAEQAARFASAHSFHGSAADRLRLLLLPDETASTVVARWRGLTNPQWLLAAPAGVIGAGMLLGRQRHPRLIAVGLLLGFVGQIAAWLIFTHIQSRFLLPCLLTLAPLAGLGLARLKRLGMGIGIVVCLAQAAGAWAIFSEQNGGRPNALLPAGPAALMGEPNNQELGRASPTAFINHGLPEGVTVVLVGGATPLYFERPVQYATVWDRPPVLDLDPAEGVAEGVYLLIDGPELARQADSGYLDPAVTPDFLSRLVARCELVRAWPDIGRVLYRYKQAEASP